MSKIVLVLLFIIIIWINITSLICWIANPQLTDMEVFLRIPKSMVLDYE